MQAKEEKHYGVYDENGEYISLHLKPQEGNCIELTHDQWIEAVEQKCKVVDGIHTVIPVTQDEITEGMYNALRYERNKLLAACDWTQMPDAPLTAEQKQAWQVYRQELRDLPATVDINNIIYPTKPE